MPNFDYYAVHRGRNPGVYATWPACKEQVEGIDGAAWHGFHDLQAARRFARTGRYSPGDLERTVEIRVGHEVAHHALTPEVERALREGGLLP